MMTGSRLPYARFGLASGSTAYLNVIDRARRFLPLCISVVGERHPWRLGGVFLGRLASRLQHEFLTDCAVGWIALACGRM